MYHVPRSAARRRASERRRRWNAAAVSSIRNLRSAQILPRAPIRVRRSASAARIAIWSARASTSPTLTMTPSSPSLIMSRTAPTSVAIIGSPAAVTDDDEPQPGIGRRQLGEGVEEDLMRLHCLQPGHDPHDDVLLVEVQLGARPGAVYGGWHWRQRDAVGNHDLRDPPPGIPPHSFLAV